MATTYNLADLPRTLSPDGSKMGEFKLAAEKLRAIFTAKNITHAFYGGFALLLLGNTRIPRDLDVVVDEELPAVRKALESETGIALPLPKVNDGVIRIKVFVERPLKNNKSETIEVLVDIFSTDLVLGRGVKLGSTQEVKSKTKKIKIMNYTQLVDTKLKAWVDTRLEAWEDREKEKHAKDIYFLVKKGGPNVKGNNVERSKLTKSRVDKFCNAWSCPAGLTSTQWEIAKAGLKYWS